MIGGNFRCGMHAEPFPFLTVEYGIVHQVRRGLSGEFAASLIKRL